MSEVEAAAVAAAGRERHYKEPKKQETVTIWTRISLRSRNGGNKL
jgi:hypothetical protein